ncbi:hypothetical protein BJX76DRAFT_366151 [Aspergillus varians]
MRRKYSSLNKERSAYDEDTFGLPALERRPSWSGTRWTRFFPEIASHFSLVSPVSSRHPSIRYSCGSEVSSIGNNSHLDLSDSEDTSEAKTRRSSLWSDKLAGEASSCYSRRSSVTSLGSEPFASPYKSAASFSVLSPSKAGVFDDSASGRRSSSAMSPRSPSVKDKPLPPLPTDLPIEMTPLSIRGKKKKQPPTIREDALAEALESTSTLRTHGHRARHQQTLSQAAEELENALNLITEHSDTMPPIDGPLQVSRSNMDMIATRTAPSPPTDILRNRGLPNASADNMKTAKESNKGRGPFSFTVPGFSKRARCSHLRSLSGSNFLSGCKQKHDHQDAASAAAAASPSSFFSSKEAEKKNEKIWSSEFFSAPQPVQRAASVSSSRSLRLQLPRLQTKEVQSSGIPGNPLDTPAADEAAPQEPLQPKRRTSSSFDSESTMANTTRVSTPMVPHEMDSGSEQIVIYYELDAGLPEQQIKTPMSAPPFVPSGQMPGTLPDTIVGLILRQCDSLQDLFNFAVMNKQFYRVFKIDELDFIKNTVFEMSPPAWELREMSPPWDSEWRVLVDLDAPVPEYTASLYLDRYTRDIYTLVKLKSLILARCGTFLRPETVRGLAGMDDTRAAEIDNAFWRVWTFCRIFGCGKGREGDVVGQLDWLKGGVMATSQHLPVAMSISEPFGINNVLFEPPEGFGRGNHGGLSQAQLYDMTEIWTCLGVLLQPIHDRCQEARKAGVFDGHDVAAKDPVMEQKILEEWTSYILTLGPSAVLALGTITTVDNADEIFQRAQSLGLTRWEPADASRSIFFREAVSKAYKPREQSPRRSSCLRQTDSNSSRSSGSSNNLSPSSSITSSPHRRRQAAYAAQLRNRRAQNQAPLSYVEERPISSYVEIMNRLAGAPPHPLYQQVPPLQTSTLTPPASIPPSQHTNTMHNIQIRYSRPPRPVSAQRQPQVLDPADQAINVMVNELGFNEEDAKWALKITDNGEGINPNAAVSLLMQEYRHQNPLQWARGNGYSVPLIKSHYLVTT